MADNVNHPAHYNTWVGDLETIDIIFALTGPVGFKTYCKGNVIKYLARYQGKGGVEDLKKARKYLDWMISYKYKPEQERGEVID